MGRPEYWLSQKTCLNDIHFYHSGKEVKAIRDVITIRPINVVTMAVLLLAMLHNQEIKSQDIEDSSNVYSIDSVVVRSHKLNYNIRNIDAVHAIDSALIIQSGALSVAEAVSTYPGVNLKSYGGVGGLKTVSLRTLGAEHTGVLLNGIPVVDANVGQIDLGRWSVWQMNQILINDDMLADLKPASAHLANHTINLKTSSHRGKKPVFNAMLGVGSFDTYRFGYHVGWGNDKMGVLISKNVIDSEGDYDFSVSNGTSSQRLKRDNNRVYRSSDQIVVDADLDSVSNLKLVGTLFRNEQELPGAVDLYQVPVDQSLANRGVSLQGTYLRKLSRDNRLGLFANYSYDGLSYRDGLFNNADGELVLDYFLHHGLASVSYEKWVSDNMRYDLATDLTFDHLQAMTTESGDVLRLGSVSHVGLRYAKNAFSYVLQGNFQMVSDRSGEFRRENLLPSLSGGVLYKPLENVPIKVRTKIQNRFRMPLFSELYYRLVGNTNLKPEEVFEWSGGVVSEHKVGRKGRFEFSADVFVNRLSNKIQATPGPNAFIWSMRNIGRVHGKGLELWALWNQTLGPIDLELGFNYTNQQALDYSDQSSDVYGSQIPYLPFETLNASVHAKYKGLFARAQAAFQGFRYRLPENDASNVVPAWTTIDVLAGWEAKVKKWSWMLQGAVKNLLDVDYQIVYNYPLPGVNGEISLIWKY